MHRHRSTDHRSPEQRDADQRRFNEALGRPEVCTGRHCAEHTPQWGAR